MGEGCTVVAPSRSVTAELTWKLLDDHFSSSEMSNPRYHLMVHPQPRQGDQDDEDDDDGDCKSGEEGSEEERRLSFKYEVV